jgi:hypothetical protein
MGDPWGASTCARQSGACRCADESFVNRTPRPWDEERIVCTAPHQPSASLARAALPNPSPTATQPLPWHPIPLQNTPLLGPQFLGGAPRGRLVPCNATYTARDRAPRGAPGDAAGEAGPGTLAPRGAAAGLWPWPVGCVLTRPPGRGDGHWLRGGFSVLGNGRCLRRRGSVHTGSRVAEQGRMQPFGGAAPWRQWARARVQVGMRAWRPLAVVVRRLPSCYEVGESGPRPPQPSSPGTSGLGRARAVGS